MGPWYLGVLANKGNCLLSELSPTVTLALWVAAMGATVSVIFKLCCPAKVVFSAVGSIAVSMGDNVLRAWGRPMKS